MATVRKNRGRWVVDFRDPHGKRHIEAPTGPFENAAHERLAAQTLLTKRLSEVERGLPRPDYRRLLFAEVCDRYLEAKVNVRPTTLRGYRSLIDLYLRPYFGKWRVQSVSATDIERFRCELSRGVPAPILDARIARTLRANPKWSRGRAKQEEARRAVGVRTINKALTLLTMIFNYGCRHRWIDYNPAEHVERLRDTKPVAECLLDTNILTPEEIRRLLDAAEDRYRLLIQVAVFTGMRQGEILGLQWGDIDWNSRQVHVRRAWKEGAFTEPKTRSSIRRVDLPERLVLELKTWRLRCPKGEFDIVFANDAGNPMSHANLLQRGFYPALRRAGVRKIRFHDLRHTFASLMIANGEDVVRVSRLLGHASPNITLGIYSHMLPKEHYGSTDRLATLIYGNSSAPPSDPAPDSSAVSALSAGVRQLPTS
jgi:integrase